jgi:hypothetical protein
MPRSMQLRSVYRPALKFDGRPPRDPFPGAAGLHIIALGVGVRDTPRAQRPPVGPRPPYALSAVRRSRRLRYRPTPLGRGTATASSRATSSLVSAACLGCDAFDQFPAVALSQQVQFGGQSPR